MDNTSAASFRDIINQFINTQINENTLTLHKRLQLTIDNLTKTKECWELVLQVLNNETDKNILILTSSILKNKFQYDFGQLTQEMFQRVHRSIFQIISKHQKPSNSLRINMSVSIALIYLHKADQLGQLLEYLSSSFNQGQNRNYIFTVLEVLPEEVNNDKVVIEEEQRTKLRNYLKRIQKNVLVELNNISRSSWQTNEIRQLTLLKCFSNWIRITEDKEVVQSLHNHFLLQKAFDGLSNSDINEECCACIEYVIKSILNPQQSPEVYGFIARQMIGFFPKIKERMDQDSFQTCQQYVKLLCIFGICSKNELISNPNQDYKQFVGSMAMLTEQSQLECEVYLNQFWEEFLVSLLDNNQASQFYKDVLEQLYLILSKSLRFDLNECEELNSRSAVELQRVNKDFEAKLIYRNQSKTLFKLLSDILVPSHCLSVSINTINSLKANGKNFWPDMECYLNPLEQVIEQLSQPSPTLNNLVSKLVEINSPFKMIQKTIIRLLSACSNVYAKNDQFAVKIFRYLNEHMRNSEMVQISSRAFENLCIYNVDFVLSHIDQFLQTLYYYKDSQRVLKGVVKALATNPSVLNKHLPKIFSLYREDLSKTAEIKPAKLVLDKFVLIFKEVTQEDPASYQQVIRKCFGELWKMIKPIMQKECKNDEQESLLEKCTKVIKYAMRCLKEYFLPFIQEIYNTVVESYSQYPVNSYVYMLQILVTVYHDNPKFQDYAKNLLGSICQITFNHLSSMEKIQLRPKLAEDFFGMISRFLRFMPQAVFDSQYFSNLLSFIVECCGIQDGPIAKIFYTLLVDFYMQYWNLELVAEYIKRQSLKDQMVTIKTPEILVSLEKAKPLILQSTLPLLQKMFQHLQTGPSTTVRNWLIEALMSEIKAFSQQNRECWITVLTPIKEDILSVNEKTKILAAVTKLTQENVEYMEEMLRLVTKRYVHRLTRSPID